MGDPLNVLDIEIMLDSPKIWIVALLILLLNLPFGFWRAGLRRLTPRWFVAIHAPIPVAVGLRYAVGMGFRLSTLPLFVAAFFAGQFMGGRIRTIRSRQGRHTQDTDG